MVVAGFYSGLGGEGKGMVEVSRKVTRSGRLGLMSGTSMDGVDAALVLTDGESIAEFGPSVFIAYGEGYRSQMHGGEPGRAGNANRSPARSGSLAPGAEPCWPPAPSIFISMRSTGSAATPQVVGFHGQTVSHRPAEGFTLQLGAGAAVAAGCGVATVWDFRSEDMKAGGEGAPLAPFFHFGLAQRARLDSPVAFLNLGGVGNVSWIDPSADAPEAKIDEPRARISK